MASNNDDNRKSKLKINHNSPQITIHWTELNQQNDFYDDDLPDPPYMLPFRRGDKFLFILTFISIISVPLHSAIHKYLSEPFYPDKLYAYTQCAKYEGLKMGKLSPIYQFRRIPYMVPSNKIILKSRSIAKGAGITANTSYRWHDSIPLDTIERCYISIKDLNCQFIDAAFTCKFMPYSRACPSLTYSEKAIRRNRTSFKTSESCQFLDIYTPYINKFYPVPVVVLLTGLNFLGEPTNKFFKDGPFTPEKDFIKKLDVVFVHLQYRLGVFGTFFNQNNKKLKNFGINDIMIGLEWIKSNILEFGGNPNSITILGHGSGATAALGLLTNPLVTKRKLFHKAWLASGSVNIPHLNVKFFETVETVLQKSTSSICNPSVVKKMSKKSHDSTSATARYFDNGDGEDEEEDFQDPWEDDYEPTSTDADRCKHGPINIYQLKTDEVIGAIKKSNLKHLNIKQNLGELADTNSLAVQEPIVGVDNSTILANPWTHPSLPDIPFVFSFTASEFEGMDFKSSNVKNPKSAGVITDIPYSEIVRKISEFDFGNHELFRNVQSDQVRLPDNMLFATSLARVGCPQHHFMKKMSRYKRFSPTYMIAHLHRPISSQRIFMFDEKKKKMSFHGIDMIHLLGSYKRLNPVTMNEDHMYAKNLQDAFKQFVYDSKISGWKTFYDGTIKLLVGSYVDDIDYINTICGTIDPKYYNFLAKIN